MSQPPHPPPGEGERPESERPVGTPVPPLPFGPDQPTQRLAPEHPGRREATRQFTPTGPQPWQQPWQQRWQQQGQQPWQTGQHSQHGAAPVPASGNTSNTVLWALVITASIVLVAVLVALVIALADS